MEEIFLTYDKNFHTRWKNGVLCHEWFAEYPDIFDEEDYRLAKKQSSYHFGEWFAAIYYGQRGYRSLLEKYGCKNHARKNKVVARYLDLEKLKTIPKFPDLFVYKENEFFFVEVKKENDRLSDKQKEYFEKIESEFKCKVILCNLKEA